MAKTNKKTRTVGNGEGSLYYSDTLERWIFQYYYNDKRKTLYQKKNERVKDFKKRVTDIKNKLNNNSLIEKNNITVYELGKEIINNKFNRNIIIENSYRRSIHELKHIKEHPIGKIPIQKISYYQLQEFIDSKKDYSSSTIDKFFILLNNIFNEALKKDYIFKNPMLKVEKPKSKKQKKQVEAFSIEEQESFLKQLTPDEPYRDIFIIALHTGMRMGEILALKVEDIDLKNKEIHIQRTLTKDKNDRTILGKSTKTYAGNRVIPITPLFEKELRHAISTRTLNIYDLIFIQPSGKLYSVSNMNSRFKRICTAANLGVKPYIIKRDNGTKIRTINSKTSTYNQHMLRHTYATRMIEAGVQAEVLQKLLGHKDIQTTINTYTTIFNKYKKEQIDKYISYIKNLK